MIKLLAAATSTAPAAISFTIFITGWASLCTTLHNFSMAVFIISIDSTKAMHKIITPHSVLEIFTAKPNTIAIIAASRWILKLVSEVNVVFMPLKA
jgi:hypothetical protein